MISRLDINILATTHSSVPRVEILHYYNQGSKRVSGQDIYQLSQTSLLSELYEGIFADLNICLAELDYVLGSVLAQFKPTSLVAQL